MSQDNLMVVNDEEIDMLIADILEYAENIKKVFQQMEGTVINTKDSFLFAYTEKVYEYFGNLKQGFDVTLTNILNYVEDLKLVKANFENIDLVATKLMQRQTMEWVDRKNAIALESTSAK